MAGPLLQALLELDTVARVGARTLGEHSHMDSQLMDAVASVRRLVAPRALREAAERFDPKTDLARIFAAAETAGLTWPDLAEALNRYREMNPR